MAALTTLGLHNLHEATLPLLSTSLTLFYAMVEPSIFIPFIRAHTMVPPGQEANINRSIRLWWTNFLPFGLGTIVALFTFNLLAGIHAIRSFPIGSRSRKLCMTGMGLSMCHFLFAPKIARVIEKVCDEEEEKKGKTREWLREWLRVHTWRTVASDVPAWLCFVWAISMQEKT